MYGLLSLEQREAAKRLENAKRIPEIIKAGLKAIEVNYKAVSLKCNQGEKLKLSKLLKMNIIEKKLK